MGYAVTYQPSYKTRNKKTNRKKATAAATSLERLTSAAKAKRTKNIRNAIRWNIDELESRTMGAATVSRTLICNLLHLGAVAPGVDPTGDHVLQQLISEGYVAHHVGRIMGDKVYDRADLLKALKSYARLA